VVLVGAGFIGCIILEALVHRGVGLTVVEMGDRMVPRMMNRTAGGLLKRWCEAKGVRVLTSARVEAIAPRAGGLAVTLSGGEALEADLVISAAGVRPTLGFLEGSGVEADQGILVNEHLETSAAGVYAAGDVAQGRDFSTGGYSVQAIQPTAVEHGQVAASNMAGRRLPHRGSVAMNVLSTLGLVSTSFGLWDGVEGGDEVEACDEAGFKYLSLQFRDDVLVGANSLGLTDHVGVLRGLIQTRVPLGAWKARLLEDPTRLMEAYLARVSPIGFNARVA
jgi:NAD(P)H-nitrite reductase large subunit